MRDAAVDRLSKLIEDPAVHKKRQVERPPELAGPLGLAEGFFSLFLLLLVVCCAIWSIQAAAWIDNLQVLTLDTLIAIIFGTWSVKQRRFASRWVYGIGAGLALLLALWQTIVAFDNDSINAFIVSIQQWLQVTSSGGHSQDESLVMPFIVLGCLMLACVSAIALYRWRKPWLVILFNIPILLFNLNFLADTYIFLLFLFLAAGLLLVLRFNLFETVMRWDLLNLRYNEELGWSVMQTGLAIITAILILSLILPGSYLNPSLSNLWLMKGSPLALVQSALGRVTGVQGATTAAPNHGNFTDGWSLGGNPNLTQDVVMKVQYSDPNDPQYLALVNYDTYDYGWVIDYAPADEKYAIKTNEVLTPDALATHTVKQTIQVVSSPQEQQPYMVGASQIISLSLPSYIVEGAGGNVAWLGNNVSMNTGLHYTVTSAVSSADEDALRAIPMPANAPRQLPGNHGPEQATPVDYFSPSIVTDFTMVAPALTRDGRIKALAESIVAHAHAQTMYDKTIALETYLRTNYSYSTDIYPRVGMDPILWFLFANPDKDGYCNYFSTAMTLMARSLGIPAREVVGYTSGTRENNEYVIRGTDAHSWTQIYFAGYGWINFEPSASFKTFTRPVLHQFSASTVSSNGTNGFTSPTNQAQNVQHKQNTGGNGSGSNGVAARIQQQLAVGIDIVLWLCLFLLVGGVLCFYLWWRRLFRHYSLAAQLYGRICMLAEWSGLKRQISQTPYEYLHEVSAAALRAPDEVVALERLGNIYVRERWAAPGSEEVRSLNGESSTLPGVWQLLRPRLYHYVVQHPFFLWHASSVAMHNVLTLLQRLRFHRKLQ